MVSEWRPVVPLIQMLSAGGSQKPQARPFTKMSLYDRLLQPITGILAGTDRKLDTTNTENPSEMMKEAEERKLQRMVKVHDFLKRRQCRQNLRGTQEESCAQNEQMTAVGYISDTDENVKASWPLFQPDGAAAF
jgi:hypothetical protein